MGGLYSQTVWGEGRRQQSSPVRSYAWYMHCEHLERKPRNRVEESTRRAKYQPDLERQGRRLRHHNRRHRVAASK
jgi:hypothetical protein